MGNWKNWLFPILTALTVAALALLPLRLSTLEDGRLTGTVHTEPLAADNNFPSKPPELPGRIWLLAQSRSIPENLTIVGQELDREKLEELSAQARAELEDLAELGVLPEGAEACGAGLDGSLLYLRDQTDLSSAAFAELSAYDKPSSQHLYLCLDGQSGKILSLTLEKVGESLLEFSSPAEASGKAFFDRLGLKYELLRSFENTLWESYAVFRLTDSETLYHVGQIGTSLRITPEVDWEKVDDGIRAAMGYPPVSSVIYDAG
ncbi:MAG: hypothetical protein K2L38_12715 [Dysosmobacter sp.]|nr:hypothetical protein [Dysosmobacter sp.]